MGSITFSYPLGNVGFSRGYIVGFTAHTGCDNFRLEGQSIKFDVSGVFFYTLPILDSFYAPSTNSYLLSEVFDIPNCFIRLADTTPVFAGMIPGVVMCPGEQEYRIAMDGTLVQNPLKRVNIELPPPVWRYYGEFTS